MSWRSQVGRWVPPLVALGVFAGSAVSDLLNQGIGEVLGPFWRVDNISEITGGLATIKSALLALPVAGALLGFCVGVCIITLLRIRSLTPQNCEEDRER